MIPMNTMAPQGMMQGQQQGQKGSSSKGAFDPLKAILEVPSQILGQLLSQDLIQARQSGVPTDNLIQTLLNLSPAMAGAKAGQSLMGGGAPPPGGPQDPNGGNKPPQDPNMVASNQDSGMPPEATMGMGQPNSINQAFLGGNQMQPQQAQGGFNPQATLAQIPTAQELQPRFNQVRNGGFFSTNKMLPNGDIQAGGPLAAMFGPTMDQISGAQGAINSQGANQAQEAAVKSAITPASQAERLTLDATRQKTQMERWDKSYEKLLEPMPSAKELSQVESAITALDNITNILGVSADNKGGITIKNKNLLNDKNWVSKNRQSILRSRDLFINKVLRRESGATITPADEKAAAKSIGFNVGVSAFLQNPDLIAKSLIETKDQLLRDRDNLSPNSTNRKFVQDAKSAGYSDAEIKQFLGGNGRLG